MSWLMMLSLACVLDRTGQSASNQMQREIRDNGVRVYNVEQQFVQVEARVNQLEALARTKRAQTAVGAESLDALREEMGRLRGELEVLTHDSSQGEKDMAGQVGDARFRIMWLESRADQLERSLGLSTPPPPAMAPTAQEETTESTWDTEGADEDPEGGAEPEAPAADPVETEAPVVTAVPDPPETPADEEPAADPVTTPALDPMTLLDNAKAQLKEGNYTGAETMLGRFLTLHPNHSRVDEATYRRAEAAMKAENYEQAVLRYQEVIDQFKGSTFAPWAMFRQGECFDAQGQGDNAKVFYGEVIRIYPKSRAAKAARKNLGR
jgi:tol-pal system protein YbgF